MGHLGLEPRTNRLKAGYSTAELMSQKGLNFQGSEEDGGVEEPEGPVSPPMSLIYHGQPGL